MAGGADLLGGLGRDQANFGLGLRQGGFDVQPGLDSGPLVEDGAHLGGAKDVTVDRRVDDVRWHG